MDTSRVLGESECRHCHLPIRLIAQHRMDPGQWYHIDGHRAHRECHNVMAEPVGPDRDSCTCPGPTIVDSSCPVHGDED